MAATEMPPELEAVIQQVHDLVRQGKLSDGLHILDRVSAEFPDNASLEYEKARMAAWKIPHAGLTQSQEYQKRFPSEYCGPCLEAHCLIKLRRGKAALKCLERARKLGAPESETRPLLVTALALAGRRSTAQKIASDDEDLPSAWQRLIPSPPESVDALEDALTRLSATGESLEGVAAYRADWYVFKGRYQDCADCLRSALETVPGDNLLQHRLVSVEIRLKHFDEAERILLSMLNEWPEDVYVLGELARISFKRRRFMTWFGQIRVFARALYQRI